MSGFHPAARVGSHVRGIVRYGAGVLDAVLAPLQQPAFFLLGVPVTWTELLGDVTGLLCVWLVARQNIWNWPIGIANNAFFALLFFSSRLYAETLLQFVFATLSVYGWWSWVHGATARSDTLPVRRTTPREWMLFAVIAVTATAAVATWLARNTDSPAPFWDALVLVLSLIATYGQARKLLESWWVWITVDLVSVPLYLSRQLYPTALLYGIFLVLCVIGLRDWQRTRRFEEVPA